MANRGRSWWVSAQTQGQLQWHGLSHECFSQGNIFSRERDQPESGENCFQKLSYKAQETVDVAVLCHPSGLWFTPAAEKTVAAHSWVPLMNLSSLSVAVLPNVTFSPRAVYLQWLVNLCVASWSVLLKAKRFWQAVLAFSRANVILGFLNRCLDISKGFK